MKKELRQKNMVGSNVGDSDLITRMQSKNKEN
jgi:hypothetical protein